MNTGIVVIIVFSIVVIGICFSIGIISYFDFKTEELKLNNQMNENVIISTNKLSCEIEKTEQEKQRTEQKRMDYERWKK